MRLIESDALINESRNRFVIDAIYKSLGGNGYLDTLVGTININTPTSDKKAYRCAYCGTLHNHNTGTCDMCGAPMGEAVEVKEWD